MQLLFGAFNIHHKICISLRIFGIKRVWIVIMNYMLFLKMSLKNMLVLKLEKTIVKKFLIYLYRWRIAAAWCTMADVQIVLAMTLHLFYLFKKNFKNYFTSNSQLYKILEESHSELFLFISVQIFTSYFAWQLANWEMVNKSTPFLKP